MLACREETSRVHPVKTLASENEIAGLARKERGAKCENPCGVCANYSRRTNYERGTAVRLKANIEGQKRQNRKKECPTKERGKRE